MKCCSKLPKEAASTAVEVWMLDDFDPRYLLPGNLWRDTDAIRYVVGRVGSAFNATCRKERRGWVALRWEEMSPLFGRSGRWNEVRRALLDREILVCDESYKVGEKAKWYKLGRALRRHQPSLARIRDETAAGRIRQLEAKRGNRDSWRPVHHHIARWLSETTVDLPTAKPWICRRQTSLKQHLTYLRIEVIQNRQAYPIVDAYGRVHSPLTNLRRAVRPALRIHGRAQAELDVSNSQPLLFGYLAAKVLAGDWGAEQVKQQGQRAPKDSKKRGNKKGGAQEHQGEKTEEQRTSKQKRNTGSTICLPNLHLSGFSTGISDDLADYLEVCQGGQFYQALAEAWGLPCVAPRDKNKVKKLAFKYVLFGPARPGHPHWEAFRGRWPSVAHVLEEIKESDHGTAARVCQRIEAGLIIGGVVERFRVERPTCRSRRSTIRFSCFPRRLTSPGTRSSTYTARSV